MSESDEHEVPGTLQRILRELPRRRVALVALVVLVNLGVVTYLRGREIGRRHFVFLSLGTWPPKEVRERIRNDRAKFSPPWEWTADEWRETVWPWK